MTGFTHSRSADPWHVDRLDLAGYLERLGVGVREPSRAALDELHEAHVRTFTFDNIDVFLEQHPGVSTAVLMRSSWAGGGVATALSTRRSSAAAQRLGYDVGRHLARVGDPADGSQQGRTHMVVEVGLDGRGCCATSGSG